MAGLCEEDFRNIADDIDLADFKIARLLKKLKCLLPKGKTNIRKRLYSMILYSISVFLSKVSVSE